MCHMTHSPVWHDSFICVTWLIHMCDMTHSYVWHDSSYVWHDSFICVTWLIHMCDMTHSYMWHDSSYVWHDSFTCVPGLMQFATWLIHICDMTHLYVWHGSFICVLPATYIVNSFDRDDKDVGELFLQTCDITHPYVWHDSFLLWRQTRRRTRSTCKWYDTFVLVTWLICTVMIKTSENSFLWTNPRHQRSRRSQYPLLNPSPTYACMCVCVRARVCVCVCMYAHIYMIISLYQFVCTWVYYVIHKSSPPAL